MSVSVLCECGVWSMMPSNSIGNRKSTLRFAVMLDPSTSFVHSIKLADYF